MLSRRTVLAAGTAAFMPAVALAREGDLRIVSMDLSFTEMLLALGARPTAIANVPLYQRLVSVPAAPADAVDLGPLTEPNLELLQYLKPDLILAASWQASALAPLERIAPVHWLPTFARGQGPLDFTRDLLARIAGLAGREAQAAALQGEADAVLAEAKERLRAQAGRPVYLLRFAEDGRRTAIFGGASMVGDVLVRAGLRNAFAGRANIWGTASIGIERLVEAPEAVVIHFERGAETARAMRRLAESPIWNALPAVRAGRVLGMPVIYPNGGTVSVTRFARQLAAVLAGVPAAHG
ncbi:ABC transporter substrate-binding protein [Bosea sp. (in: a-proteobacteria)]|jgi:iron complex transport system substrate-binding protein|uniref:ABC transporter substrate-binding protein n=1 Tax=Bosea sp. (in: a-proteobacteria) TaxID=1871050 RepID=UPI002DDC9384|nr:ABC transporter substrate-binding protein [Bosea sp. (in: a-proteobacteria)]HEV2512922.1 ABC transporter substrate-binding protein [Bosea sp. (in: a-proteobacteria)]